MTTILVPTDFSPVSKNAALYAFKLAEQMQAQRIIFYNTYQAAPAVINETGLPSMPLQVNDVEFLREISSNNMKQFRQSVEANCPQGIVISEITEFGTIEDGINEICNNTGAGLIVIGINNASKAEEILLGSTVTSVATHTKVPVIAVPEGNVFSTIKKVVLACDYKNIADTTPVQPLKFLLSTTGAALHILNVEEKEANIDTAAGEHVLTELLQVFQPTFHYVRKEDFMKAVNEFVGASGTDLVVTIPKKHSFLHGLFKESHTKKLAFHSHVPVMYIHEEDL